MCAILFGTIMTEKSTAARLRYLCDQQRDPVPAEGTESGVKRLPFRLRLGFYQTERDTTLPRHAVL